VFAQRAEKSLRAVFSGIGSDLSGAVMSGTLASLEIHKEETLSPFLFKILSGFSTTHYVKKPTL
jgi:hypothetical protein